MARKPCLAELERDCYGDDGRVSGRPLQIQAQHLEAPRGSLRSSDALDAATRQRRAFAEAMPTRLRCL